MPLTTNKATDWPLVESDMNAWKEWAAGISKGKPDMPTVESQPIRLQVRFLAESDRGYTVSNQNARTWLPRRLCQIDPAGAPVGETCHATMPDWLAKESGLLGPTGLQMQPSASIAKPLNSSKA